MKISGRKHAFSYFYLEKICTLTVQGWTLKKIGDLEEMPSVSTLYSWLKRYPVLKRTVRLSKENRELFKTETEIESLFSFAEIVHHQINF